MAPFFALAISAAGARAAPNQGGDDPPPARARTTPSPPLTDPSVDPDAPSGRSLKLLGRLVIDYGGEEIIRVQLSDGDERSLQAGQGLTLAAGLMYQATAPWALEATIGYKLAFISLSNGNSGFTRIPLDIIASVAGVGHRVGIGGTAHLKPTYTCQVSSVCNVDITLDTAYGLILQYAYSTVSSNRAMDLGLRITLLNYTAAGESIEANSIGVFASGRL